MERLITTADGSHSLMSPLFNQQYHSLQGALTESIHIYINLGLQSKIPSPHPISIFEMGFGTGLNALLAWQLAETTQTPVHYTTVEAYPITLAEARQLNYPSLTNTEDFLALHQAGWGEDIPLSPYFTFRKENRTLQELSHRRQYEVIFYDAFDPRAQPELWTTEIFTNIAAQTAPNGVLVTYSSKGIVKRALQAAGFLVTKHRGPGKKFHVLKAVKI
ncbi:tRNA U34 5-methylaminomethyl-2-thiouridine-forming methyltransferase MnmC [Dyadobacter jejuensis]|uniref:tRNA U34 5-methylaminomethyl-2-thiouridine-forming methyltransferase MnmC n=1 Tax=Dyadobacter jejuensis TaxID=1082580 RepID=A0A316B290_9BACT|nr:tRNA (5-methylaminomethyl-2-thiouridine)(34)-methyltransferase MnmD [Dyadobacter jejuensis]PWJ56647.1 tRNA U34 5-methylaminomethyl-2-thiouridine-forming methyltransferase MnmC [Dyadobacter jejuensis]